MKKYRFYKEKGEWFIDIPKFPFDESWLAMVMGADLLLDKLSQGKEEVTLGVSTRKIRDFEGVILRENKLGLMFGAVYKGGTPDLIPTSEIGENRLWLCPATLYVFWRYPKKIYFKIL